MCSCFPQARGAGQDGPFRAGAATVNITPPLGQPIVGGFSPVPATYVRDELHTRCLVLDDGRRKLAILLSDNVGIPREVHDAAKAWIDAETGIPPGDVLSASTHTHSATSARGENKVVAAKELTEYQRFVARRMADCARIALGNLEPAKIAWGRAEEPEEVFNRRWYVRDESLLQNPFGGIDRVRMNPPRGSEALIEPAGPVDPEIAFVSVRSRDGRPICLLANYSLHYVGGVPSGHISADYFGAFARRIGPAIGAEPHEPEFVGILSNGTSGNINNIDFRSAGERTAPYEKIERVASRLASLVAESERGAAFHDRATLDARLVEVTLGVRKPSPEQIEWAKGIRAKLAEGQPKVSDRDRVYCARIEQLASESPDEIRVPVQAIRIGPLGIAALPFEVFVETGLSLKKERPMDSAFTIELANGSFGYLPTADHHALGGYETWIGTCNVEVGAAARLEQRVLELWRGMREADGNR
ncbi:MAG: hypothetical protein FJ297_10520 [Planctomycetes bacterium]|nr:hypothetical protein [Planctomycetota bacterium]